LTTDLSSLVSSTFLNVTVFFCFVAVDAVDDPAASGSDLGLLPPAVEVATDGAPLDAAPFPDAADAPFEAAGQLDGGASGATSLGISLKTRFWKSTQIKGFSGFRLGLSRSGWRRSSEQINNSCH